MAYKITKYGGKHKIKDTKTGKSVDIDIEKYMNGGSSTPKYANGVEFDCPEGDIECIERQKALNPPVHDSLQGYTPQNILGDNYGLIDETTNRPQTSTITPVTSKELIPIQGASPNLSELVQTGPIGVNAIDTTQNNFDGRGDEINDDIYNIPNPYAGTDIPSAANFLGESIQNKDPLGIAASSLKIAAGLGRNVVSGLGRQNRNNQVMKKFQEDQKKRKNPVQYLAYGGKKDEELATGEYMHGITNENIEEFNAEIEKGEYFQTNVGDIAEVVGDKHSQGGEKIQMEAEDRVLSDKLKLGAKSAKMLSEKYDIKLKAKNTYADVLDKFKRKSKLGKLVEEEAEILKKIGEQDKVEDATTRDFNLEVLTKKKEEIAEQKHPIEEQRKGMFDELFEIQEESKPKDNKTDNNFEAGGKLEELAAEYGVPLDRAKEIVKEFSEGGKIVPKYANGKRKGLSKELRPGQSRTDEGFFGEVTPEQYEKFIKRNSSWFDFTGFDPSNSEDVKKLQETYNSITNGRKVTVDGKFGEQTESLALSPELQTRKAGIVNPSIVPSIDLRSPRGVSISDNSVVEDNLTIEEEKIRREQGLAGAYLFPNESPLPPTSLQGTIKPERRFDRVRPTEIEVEPYLQDIKDREEAQVQSLEGLSPNVRAAVLANMRANNQTAESQIRNKIDTQNLASEEKAIYTNAQIQRTEENASAADRLNFEQRQYRAQALTENDLSSYYTQLQDINKQKFMDIHNLNLVNATNEDVYFDGQTYRRKNSDRDILRQIKV